jgi:hypothetical protein
MFWSSDPTRIANVGDRVWIPIQNNLGPYTIVRRFRNKTGQAFFVFKENDKPFRVECYSYWPEVGDTVLVNLEPYLSYLAEQSGRNKTLKDRLAAYSENVISLMGKYTLEQVKGDMATIDPVSDAGDRLKLPVRAVLVFQKKDGAEAR